MHAEVYSKRINFHCVTVMFVSGSKSREILSVVAMYFSLPFFVGRWPCQRLGLILYSCPHTHTLQRERRGPNGAEEVLGAYFGFPSPIPPTEIACSGDQINYHFSTLIL